MKRVAKVIRLKEGCRDLYEKYHRNIWMEVASNLKRVHLQNYSISWIDDWLFSYYEYTGSSYNNDMKLLASMEANQRWRAIMTEMQESFDPLRKDKGWIEMEEVFYLE